MADRVAELRGLLTELDICENGPRLSRREAAALVRKEIARAVEELHGRPDAAEILAEAARVCGEPAAPASRGKRTAKAAPPPERT